MPVPALPLLGWIAHWCAIGVVAGVWPAARALWLVAGLILVAAAAFDAWRGRRLAQTLTVSRTLPSILPVGRTWSYVVRLRTPNALRVVLADVLPLATGTPPTVTRLVTPGDARVVTVHLQVTPDRRGSFGAGSITTRVRSPWLAWDWQTSHPQTGTVRVYPDFSEAAGGAIATLDLRMPPAGLRRTPRRGHGLEFKELREYREGDSLRLVDWKATARAGRPITREYEDQRDQQVLLVLDCGHRLRARDDALSHFDHVLNATLRLAAVALAQGDAVGAATIAADTPRLLLPAKGRASLPRLVQGLYDLEPGHRVPDYLTDARRIHDRVTRRSLVVIITALRDEDQDSLHAATRLLRQRHRVLVASLREQVLDDVRSAPVSSVDDAARWASTLEYLQAREAVIRRLRRHGVDVLDVPPPHLASSLAAHYWRLKRSGAL